MTAVVCSDLLSFYYVMWMLLIVNVHQSILSGIHLAKLALILASAKEATRLENMGFLKNRVC